ncbi:MAG: beta-glucosidase, partial [Anaerolineae bacterium]|nr:beta-glucosidase [Anaerolineae bacterium]
MKPVDAAKTTDTEARIESLLADMSLTDQVALLAGESFWLTVPIDRLGIPAIKVTDGPNGARGGGALVGGVRAACFPVGISLAATWNTALVEQVGQALAEEALSKG